MLILHARRAACACLILSAAALTGCAHRSRPPVIALDEPAPEAAALQHPALLPAPRPVPVLMVPEPLPLPGQLKPIAPMAATPQLPDPASRISAANDDARMEPVRDGFLNAVQLYPFSEGALYQVYAAPGHVTDIPLQQGERLVGAGPVAAGDTARWIIGDTVSGTGPAERVHILVKPTRPDLRTNLVINTDRRTYLIELKATPRTWMASVSWTYPHDQIIAIAKAATATAEPVAAGLALEQLRFRYRISGDDASWRPVRAFDDGGHVYVEFPAGIAQGEMPPLFVLSADGRGAELVNYRVRGRHMIVDRLFGAAELRLGGRRQQRVRIERTDGGRARD